MEVLLKMRFLSKIFVSLILFLAASCAGDDTPSTPLETFKTYTKAIKQKDTTTMKLLLSAETMKMHELEANAQNVTVDDIVKRETLFSEDQKTVRLRNEKIDGDTATLEVENSFGAWETVPFVREDDVWKIDKKGYRDRFIQEVEQDIQQFDDKINQGKQP